MTFGSSLLTISPKELYETMISWVTNMSQEFLIAVRTYIEVRIPDYAQTPKPVHQWNHLVFFIYSSLRGGDFIWILTANIWTLGRCHLMCEITQINTPKNMNILVPTLPRRTGRCAAHLNIRSKLCLVPSTQIRDKRTSSFNCSNVFSCAIWNKIL